MANKGGLNKDGGISFERKRNFGTKKKSNLPEGMFTRKPEDKIDEVEEKPEEPKEERNIDVKGTASADDITPLFKTFNFSIDCPTQFLGATGTAGEPEVWAKALPDLSITYGGSVKYDTETDKMVEAFRDPSSASVLVLYLADVPVDTSVDTPANEFFNTASGGSSVKFGMWAGKSKLTSCEVSSDDVAMVNFEAKVLAPSSGNTLHLLGGDNV